MLVPLIILLVAAAVICWCIVLYQPQPKYPRPRFAKWPPRRGGTTVYSPSSHQHVQLTNALTGQYHVKQILNHSEYRVFCVATRIVNGTKYHVWPQVSLGEVLSSPDEAAFRAINAKRCDLVIADHHGRAILAIEYNGSGHDLSGDAAIRDRTKQAALEAAGVRYVAIDRDETSGRIEWILRAELAKVEQQKFVTTR